MKKRKKIVILLGAGFPIAWGAPNSKTILKKLLEDPKYMYDEKKTWGQFIYDVLADFYEEGKSTINFETVIAALELIMNYNIAATNRGKNTYNTSFMPAVLFLNNKINKGAESEKDKRLFYTNLYKHFVQIVINCIEKYDNEVCSHQHETLNKQFNDFIFYLSNKKYSVKIYTTNYDSIVPQILADRKIYMGEKLLPDLSTYYSSDFTKNKDSKLSYFYLHGSIYWSLKFVNEYRVIKSSFSGEVQSLHASGGNPNEPLIFSPIITGYAKTQRSFIFPFSMGFTNLANDCNNCNKLLTIGYSFSDTHINSIIQNNTDFNKVRFANIGFVEKFEDSSEFVKIDYDIRRLNKLNEDESWFNSINNNFISYKRGISEFLKYRENWGRI